MFERLSRSFQLARDSWGVLSNNKRFLLFPLVSGLACVLVMIGFMVPLAAMRDQVERLIDDQSPLLYVILFAYYFCNYFVIIFFNAALVSCALMQFNGQQAGLGDGLRAAGSRLPQIFAWALVSATVGLLLKLIENVHEKAGEIISAILGTVWTALTYFVVPVLVVEQVGPFQAVSRSTSLLKKTWGEAVVGHIGIGLFSLLLLLPVILLGIGAGMAFQASTALGVALLVATVVAFLAWGTAISALQTIYLTALYQYAAHNVVPQGFDGESMSKAFYGKTA